jgi:hypothetical protein
LYLGDAELLNIEAAARIEVVGASALRSGVAWQYWGKVDGSDEVAWQPLALAQPQPAGGGVLLDKPKGVVEVKEIAGRSGRWIRAYRPKSDAIVAADEFAIRINSADCNKLMKCPDDPDYVSPPAEGMANTTPLVLENVFFPLGREPRQFDAFYLGSKEVFSKPKADVQLCFQMADPKFKALGSLRGGLIPDVLFAGVAADGHLHMLLFDPAVLRLTRFRNRQPVRPPSPDQSGAAAEGSPITLDRAPAFRPAMWIGGATGFIAVTAGNDVWLWCENSVPSQSGWLAVRKVVPNPDDGAAITGLAHLASGTKGYLFALRNKKLYSTNLDSGNPAWQEVPVKDGATTIELLQIAEIQVEAQNRGSAFAEGLIGVSATEKLYGITLSTGASGLTGAATKLLDGVAIDVTPAAIRRSDNRLVAVAIGKPIAKRKALAFRSLNAPQSFALDQTDKTEIEWPLQSNSVDVNIVGGAVTAAFGLQAPGGESAIALWSPSFGSADTPLFRTRMSSTLGVAEGAPTLLPQHIMVPMASSEVVLAPVDLGKRQTRVAPLGTAFVAETSADRLVDGDFVAYFDSSVAGALPRLEKVVGDGKEVRRKVYYQFLTPAVKTDTFVYKATTQPRTGKTRDADHKRLKLRNNETGISNGTFLLITTDKPPALYMVDGAVINDVATLDRDLDFTTWPGDDQDVLYQKADPIGISLQPMLVFNPPATWDAAVLDRVQLMFPGADPLLQDAVAIELDVNHPKSVALGKFWTTAPPALPGGVAYILDESIGEWSRQLADTSTNPDLSWEYWNGTGWWTLGTVHDNTLNLKKTGDVIFTVPNDLRESDWSGKTNFWIRARLIGGDYGQEKVTVTSTPSADGKSTEQTVERSTDGIRAPSVLKLLISYRLCERTRPTFLLTEDSGSVRDQSDANRTPGAIVEAFVPLSVILGRLSGEAPTQSDTAAAGDCRCGKPMPSDCGCGGVGKTAPPSEATPPAAADCGCGGHGKTSALVATRPAATAVTAASRALLIGVNAPLTDAPVNLLFLVDERKHGELAPLTVEALVADRFERIVASDDTRAVGESGVVSMAFPTPPTPRELFGRTLTWLRLSPRPVTTSAEWKPSIRGTYLNAVWASATETLTRELLGSSDGAPFLTFRLARPPVLRDTLELRVREPLGDEERAELTDSDPTHVARYVEGLPGDWVRWDRVTDPGDEPPGARVYAFDESIGEVRFGDGLHGMIPPIGRDSIVAFSYKRTEPPAPGSDAIPANGISARTALNLVTPVESVEAVIAADQAAGGAPPESVDRVVRFGFSRVRHRRRVVTARDLEDIALQSSPDIAQARAFPMRAAVKLVVVMKGRVPTPTAAHVRELRRVILEASPSSLAEPGALQIVGPLVRRLRVELKLRIESLDRAGALAKRVKEKLTAFFDTMVGGLDQRGWRLGVNPTEDDIALALIDIEYLDGMLDVRLREVSEDGRPARWPDAMAATQIAMLAADPVRIEFETAEVIA